MEQVKNATYQTVLEHLLACGPLKTWSLIVTILGDLAAQKGAGVPGPVITQLTEPMGVRPEALRVAIHRLRRDGWITSQRDGRMSRYALTDHGRALTRDVSDRIYGAISQPPDQWHVLIAQNGEAMQGLDFAEMIAIGPRSALVPGEVSGLPETVLSWTAEPGHVPEWVREAAAPRELTEAYETLAGALGRVTALVPPDSVAARAVLRLLALHQWRRLVLRHGAGVDVLMGADWAGAICRTRINSVLALLERPGIDDI